jgi:predicted O-methyltransferase YrrM
MTDELTNTFPAAYSKILKETELAGFTMASDVKTCSLLRTLAATKPNGAFLELGTGTGLSTAWILDGMSEHATLLSIDNEEKFLNIATKYIASDQRLTLLNEGGESWLKKNADQKFDFIFADTWPGKYLLLEETISMLSPGGLYILDDMSPQPNWPQGHDLKANELMERLTSMQGIYLTKLVWATGIIIITKTNGSRTKKTPSN